MAAAAPGPRLYRPRRPARTVHYRAPADQFERVLAVYEGRFERTHGFLSCSVEKAVDRYLGCYGGDLWRNRWLLDLERHNA